ncbi:A/G-specific adenine glycosylase [Allosphingosinicella indica]|uniref:Adenine DNA glycosylase n=1 Tax=Allosphingosinicella indica TaxID=941907 RepID=A0A1X7GFC1_9SPHN|nr:A/G-specific adenine glycosylase [Allosphingosinicella indica]SMF68775.1 A/G-specific DNA-adenine glycosylase [Allosphingosinicella indica]
MPVDAWPELLRWYDVHARDLPWRAKPGETPDPYRVWLSEVMLQQTTVAAVRSYFARFTERWPTVDALAEADEGEVMAAWAGLGYYARARNLVACARAVAEEHDGIFPDTEEGLRALPGIGAYTAAAIATIAFGRRAVVVDANVERVVTRLFAIETPLAAARPEIRARTDTITPDDRAGDFAQAMMDLGATICTPRNPACAICPLSDICTARRRGDPEAFPVKAPRAARPHRHGDAYWVEYRGQVLLVRRPAKGLLGGMLALPTGQWTEAPPPLSGAPIDARWEEGGAIEHGFTHFTLALTLRCAEVRDAPVDGIWWPADRIAEAGLPTLFAKLAARGLAWREQRWKGAA